LGLCPFQPPSSTPFATHPQGLGSPSFHNFYTKDGGDIEFSVISITGFIFHFSFLKSQLGSMVGTMFRSGTVI